ncbi:MAG TPA: DNA polymerase III subunit gamma/tau [Oceanobacillus sp.]|nr:DNA polymerase III subunit gamma/tau [Oceanobacillus sp.]
MPEQALYLKWRPLSFDAMVGQEHITRTLRNALKSDRIRHAYLFSGPRGTGKTTSARLLAKAVNCLHPDPEQRPCNQCSTCVAVNEGRFLDLIEIDAATHTGVDDVRELRDKIAFAPGEGRYKIYIIDEVHRFSGSAFDALLKTLEEPPDHAIFVLATTEIDKVPATIKSRCLQFEFRRFSVREVADRLQEIVENEGLKAERAALEMVARQGTGSMRDSVSLLDQIITDPQEVITLEMVQRVLGTASSAAVRDLVEALIHMDAAEGLRVINRAIDSGTDPRQFGQQVVEHLRAVLLTQTAGAELVEASQEDRALYAAQAANIQRNMLVRALRAFSEAVSNFKGGWQPQLPLELALIESVRGEEVEAHVAVASPTPARATKPQQPLEAEPEVEAQPSAPPVVPAAVINESWDKVLRALLRYSKTSPEVMSYFKAQRVDGNVVVLATDNAHFFERINPYPEKRKTIEKALKDVFGKPLKVQVQLVSDMNIEGSTGGMDLNDPILSTGLELGAEIRRLDEQNS